MSSVQPKRKWINEQLTAAEETEFKEIIKSEEDMDNQRRPLDFSRIPMIILHRLDDASWHSLCLLSGSRIFCHCQQTRTSTHVFCSQQPVPATSMYNSNVPVAGLPA
ncbi:uncharacterized protein LOC122843854 isoform X2 [Gambusia affinis]|uniref:uncharacterized protein LOC122843854 isoform X2 n=1 Tax=Gambusia affinis TaxID=33528 RepID=UPI001CDBBBE9|nr:uncharacterized protein LOC122843854 isoform X2 [Gambusia affinis]